MDRDSDGSVFRDESGLNHHSFSTASGNAKSCGVMVITFVSHTRGSGFDPQQD